MEKTIDLDMGVEFIYAFIFVALDKFMFIPLICVSFAVAVGICTGMVPRVAIMAKIPIPG